MSYQCPDFDQKPIEVWSFEIIHKNCGNCLKWLGDKCEDEGKITMTKKYIGVKIIDAWAQEKEGKEGYAVKYPDGYISWSPKDVFEEAYRLTDGLTFGLALEAAKKGMGMRLPSWQPDVVIRAQFPDEHSKMTAPYLYVESRFGRVPWKETMIELFSDKWQIV